MSPYRTVCRAARPLVAIVALAAACGYRPVLGRVPGGASSVRVPIAGNDTSYAGLAGPLTSAVRRRLSLSGVDVVTSGAAPRLEMRIVRVEGTPDVLGVNEGRLAPLAIEWSVSAEARIVSSSGETMAGPRTFSARGRSLATGSVAAEESLAERGRLSLVDALADEIVSGLFEAPEDSAPSESAPNGDKLIY